MMLGHPLGARITALFQVLSTICLQIIYTVIPLMLLFSLVVLWMEPMVLCIPVSAPMSCTPSPCFLSSCLSILKSGIAGMCHCVWSDLSISFCTGLCIPEDFDLCNVPFPSKSQNHVENPKNSQAVSALRGPLFTSTLTPEIPFLTARLSEPLCSIMSSFRFQGDTKCHRNLLVIGSVHH